MKNELKSLYHYKVSIYKKGEKLPWYREQKKDEFINEKVVVLDQNDTFIVLKDWYFTKLYKEKNSHSTCLNKVSLYARTRDTILDNGVFYTLYSDKPKTAKYIKKEIQAFIQKEFGWLSEGIDLSVIK